VLVYASLYKPYVYSLSSLYTRADWHSPGPGLRASHGGSVVISRLHRREADDLGPGKLEEKNPWFMCHNDMCISMHCRSGIWLKRLDDNGASPLLANEVFPFFY
jgi:hypothetical protein